MRIREFQNSDKCEFGVLGIRKNKIQGVENSDRSLKNGILVLRFILYTYLRLFYTQINRIMYLK